MTEQSMPSSTASRDTTGAAAAVTLEDVRHVAALANLQLTADEEPQMQRDLNSILVHVSALRSLDTSGVPPMAQVGELLAAAPALAGASLRQDVARESVNRSAVMHEAPETDGRFFKVPKVIER